MTKKNPGETGYPRTSFKVKVGKGTRFYDVDYFLTDSFNFAISEKLYNLFLQNNFTSWDGYPIEIDGPDLKYFGFRVLGKCGPGKNKITNFGIENIAHWKWYNIGK